MDLNEISAFISIVQAGGLSRASEQTGLPKSTLSRKLAALERRLGLTLLQRTTRKITLTKTGEEYFKQCSLLLRQLDEVEKEVVSEQTEPQGVLRFTAPVEAGAWLLAPVIKKFCELYPKIALDLVFTDRIVDLVGEGFDVALRAGNLKDSSLKAKKIGKERFVLVASRTYLKKAGTPKTVADLQRHRLIGFNPKRESLVWILSGPEGKKEIPLENCLRNNSLANCRGLAVEGLGISLLPRFLIQEDLAKGRLEPVLTNYFSDRGELALMYANQKYVSPKTRVFVNFVAEELKTIIW
jgi:DNA-binding transcriptional LysR family regulator